MTVDFLLYKLELLTASPALAHGEAYMRKWMHKLLTRLAEKWSGRERFFLKNTK